MLNRGKREDYLLGWRDLVEEIAEIEELITDARKSEDTQALWSLHLLRSTLKVKQQQLNEYLKHPH